MKATRRLVQLAFLALTVVGVFVVGGHAERWCPFGGVEALYMYSQKGNLLCSLGVSNFYVLGGVLLLALLARRVFCGYACPVGTIFEWTRSLGRWLGIRDMRVPYALDRALALLKYAILGVILYLTWRVSELVFRGYDPCYVLISRHGEDITIWAYVISGVLVLMSLVLAVPFCRWLCPMAAVFTPFSRFGLARIRRQEDSCADCALCARACPMGIRVDRLTQVTEARCTSCMDCIVACPRIKARGNQPAPAVPALAWGPPRWMGGRWPQAVAVWLLLGCIGGAVAATYLLPLPSFVHSHGERPANSASVRLVVSGVKCRHSTEEFVKFLLREDELKVHGFLRVEAWPAPGQGVVRIIFDPAQTGAAAIQQAITEPKFDDATGRWGASPFAIEGYDPLAEHE